MTAGTVTSLDMRAIESILEMGGGYVLDFTDRSFAEFFAEHGVQIDDCRYSAQGTSKAEAELLRRVFRPEIFAKLPVEPSMSAALVGRMEEAHRCIESKANLAAVILCGFQVVVAAAEDLVRAEESQASKEETSA